MTATKMIPLYQPYLRGNESTYLTDCVTSSWVSGRGPFVERFEQSLSAHFGGSYCSSVCNGTVALHLALHALTIGQGDEVILPSFTYVATANAVMYVGATPVFADSCRYSWHLSICSVERLLTSKTRAIILPHLYGGCADVVELAEFCREKKILLIEDAAEALGSTFAGTPLGTFGEVGTLSFYGNKIITTGEGGAVLTKNEDLHLRIEKLKSQALAGGREYWHDELGFNYRMSNVTAALGVAQLENLEEILGRKRKIGLYFRDHFRNLPIETMVLDPRVKSNFWLYSFAVDSCELRDAIRKYLLERGVETRPLFPLVSDMPLYKNFPVDSNFEIRPVSERGLSIPSWPGLTDLNVERIASLINEFYRSKVH